ncbi:MAG: aromatic ring hydroxylase, partial [Peptococcaceae bacterium]|nr:aromatic ring hydroxylase [Peptococcaceae bacterium]
MVLRTREQYIADLGRKNKNVYCNGELIDRLDERQRGAINVMSISYDMARDPQYADLFLARSHITGKTISRFTHMHQSTEDLHKKQDMTRCLCNRVGTCAQRCMGIDAANAVNAVSYEAQKRPGGKTKYYDNFIQWLTRFQEDDLVASCAQTDVKGDRMKRPGQQIDPDQYVHVVEERADGILVSGSKVHISEASISDEIIVVPTRSLVKGEEAYAVSFALPSDDPGIKQIMHCHNPRGREHYQRGLDTGYTDSYVIFDQTFVPWERVFLCGETDLGGILALLFALFHRHSYAGCKPATLDYTIGLASLAAEINGISKAAHVKKALAELIMIGELGYAAGYTASDLGKPEVYIPGVGQVPFGPGAYIPNTIYANVGRCLSGESVWKEQEILCDLAGGLPATYPYEKDFMNPATKEYCEKYTRCDWDMEIDDQIKF